ncbi:UNVERIFIED_CONTAM: hypothetical protein RMT77_006896 [Armadillidium vulgare]
MQSDNLTLLLPQGLNIICLLENTIELNMSNLCHCILGPRLYRIYNQIEQNSNGGDGTIYTPNSCERLGNIVTKGINVMWNIGLYTSPFIITYLYKKNYFCYMGCLSLGRFATGIGLLFVVGMIMKGLGRCVDSTYLEFLEVLKAARRNYSIENKIRLSKYDFEFWAWPVDFNAKEAEGDDSKPFTQVERAVVRDGFWGILYLPCQFAAYCCIHLFGRHLMYPGSIQLLQALMANVLEEGREKLVKSDRGSRSKIITRDGNSIDTMFIDRRQSKNHLYGSTLVVCCEGNAGFYEVGLMGIPLEAGYSVLGWNHPGFAGSTGLPFPSQEQHAVDAVMQFAINKLNFKPQDIIIYAWSIGGYTGTWAAMNYPQIRGLLLDATFDDIVPLAVPRMPGYMSGLVKVSIRQFMNLNISDQLCRYPGPVTIIRRTNDEIITTTEGIIGSNRGNNLLIKLLQYRYPNLYDSPKAADALRQWVSEDQKLQDAIYNSLNIDEDLSLGQLVSFMEEHGQNYPLTLGEDMNDEQKMRMLLFIAHKIFVNFKSSHNNPLDVQYFKVPWTLMTDPSFVQI